MNYYINLIEEISLNAWPAHKIQLYDGWLLRFSHNYTHRTHCVNPVTPSTLPLSEKIAFCEREYIKTHTPSIFKINPLLGKELDPHLENLGYHIEHTTDVLTRSLDTWKPLPSNFQLSDMKVTLNSFITDEWIHNLFQLNGTSNPTHIKIVPSMFKAIPKPTIVASIVVNNTMIASGLGILDRNHIGLYAIYVDSNYRNKGIAQEICNSIINEAKEQGATHAYLQVVSKNKVAKQLYDKIGFKYLYTYWFRTKNFL